MLRIIYSWNNIYVKWFYTSRLLSLAKMYKIIRRNVFPRIDYSKHSVVLYKPYLCIVLRRNAIEVAFQKFKCQNWGTLLATFQQSPSPSPPRVTHHQLFKCAASLLAASCITPPAASTDNNGALSLSGAVRASSLSRFSIIHNQEN